jgi:hypothetical protein
VCEIKKTLALRFVTNRAGIAFTLTPTGQKAQELIDRSIRYSTIYSWHSQHGQHVAAARARDKIG